MVAVIIVLATMVERTKGQDFRCRGNPVAGLSYHGLLEPTCLQHLPPRVAVVGNLEPVLLVSWYSCYGSLKRCVNVFAGSSGDVRS